MVICLISRDPVRVCDKYHEKIEHARAPFTAKLINRLDAENISQTVGGLLLPNGICQGDLSGVTAELSRGIERGQSGGTGSDVQWGVQKLTEY